MNKLKQFLFLLLLFSMTSCLNYLAKVDWSIPEHSLFRDNQLVSSSLDSNTIYLLMVRQVTPFHYRRLIYEYNINDSIAHIAVDTTFGEMECIQSKQNGDIVFSGISVQEEKPGLFVYERGKQKIRKIVNTPSLIHHFFLMADDRTIYFTDSTLNKINNSVVCTESFLMKTDTTFNEMSKVWGQEDVNQELIGLANDKKSFTFSSWKQKVTGNYDNKHFIMRFQKDEPQPINTSLYFKSDVIENNITFKMFPYNSTNVTVLESWNYQDIFQIDLVHEKKETIYQASQRDKSKDVLLEYMVWLDSNRFILYDNPWEVYYFNIKKRFVLVNLNDKSSKVLTIWWEGGKRKPGE